MTFDPIEGSNDLAIEEFVMAAAVTIDQGDAVILLSDGTVSPGADTAGAVFLGWADQTRDNTAGGLSIRVAIGAQVKTNVVIIGSGGSGVLVQTDIGNDVEVVGTNSYDAVGGGVQNISAGRLIRIRSAGTSNDGRGDIAFLGFSAS